jgi:hypothetical protein
LSLAYSSRLLVTRNENSIWRSIAIGIGEQQKLNRGKNNAWLHHLAVDWLDRGTAWGVCHYVHRLTNGVRPVIGKAVALLIGLTLFAALLATYVMQQ